MRLRDVITIAALAVLETCTGCTPSPAPSDPSAQTPNAFGVDASGTSCAQACARLAALHCPESKPTKSGVECATICERGQGLEGMPTTCVAGATSIPAVRACGVRCAE